MRINHSTTEDETEAVIAIEGLERPLTLMHITDSHVIAGDKRDPEGLEAGPRFDAMFRGESPGNTPQQQCFDQALDRSNQLKVDGTVLTGDIIHFPAVAAVELLENGLKSLQSPYLYTVGNHDWYFPHLPWNDDTREAYLPRLAHLMGHSPAAQVMKLGGVRLLALDNSNYQMTDEQLEFLRQQLGTGDPCLLFIHIPLYSAALGPAVLDKWRAPIMMAAEGWTDETRATWQVGEDDASTGACHAFLTGEEAKNLAGVFCGHVHFPHEGELRPGCVQYVTCQGFSGGYRVIRLKPL